MPTDLGDSSSGVFFVLFLSCHTVHVVLNSRILKWFAITFFSRPHFVRTLHHDLFILGEHLALHGMAHNFIELNKAVVHVISLISFL